jgi:predicted nucleic-acid-binding protein
MRALDTNLLIRFFTADSDLSDMLIAHSAKINGSYAVITFDKEAAKSDLFEMLE